MKGMLPGIVALVLGVGCGARTFLSISEVEVSGDTMLPDSAGGDATDPSPVTLVPLTPRADGSVEGNTVGIVGSWYAWGDGWSSSGPPGACETLGMFPTSECSSIQFPSPQSFPQSPPGTFCLTGTAAKVIGSPLNYADIYGIGIGLDFNNSGGVKMPYDATTYHVIGFQFDIAHLPTATGGEVRVELPTPETSAEGFAYWGKALAGPLPNGGQNVQILFSDLGQLFPSMEKPPPFNPAHLLSIQFYVPSVETNAIPVRDLCVSNLQAIVQD
jgi:hypothetical protein